MFFLFFLFSTLKNVLSLQKKIRRLCYLLILSYLVLIVFNCIKFHLFIFFYFIIFHLIFISNLSSYFMMFQVWPSMFWFLILIIGSFIKFYFLFNFIFDSWPYFYFCHIWSSFSWILFWFWILLWIWFSFQFCLSIQYLMIFMVQPSMIWFLILILRLLSNFNLFSISALNL